jgi:molybdopterin-guanine dinucleotide biosynthesis protein A
MLLVCPNSLHFATFIAVVVDGNPTSLVDVDSVELSVVLLAGGSSRRMGSDKANIEFGSGTLLTFQLKQIPSTYSVVAVGETIDARSKITGPTITGPTMSWTRENPPGAGPVAALAAGLELVNTPAIALIAVDAPFALPRLLQCKLDSNSHALIPREHGGKVQYLAGLYRSESLRRALKQLGSPTNKSMRELTAHLPSIDYLELGTEDASDFMDIDTPQDLVTAREILRMHRRVKP